MLSLLTLFITIVWLVGYVSTRTTHMLILANMFLATTLIIATIERVYQCK